MSSKNILLISFTFPPYPGIGGRRWAKFAKYLAKQGYIIHVICSKNPFNEKSLWWDDIKHDNIKVYELASSYPLVLTQQPQTILEKVKYHLALLKVNLFSKGTPYDKSIFWNKNMLEKSEELVSKHSIKNVIVSCAPFSSSYHVLQLKEKFQKLNLIVDFRDPWTWGTGYGFSVLEEKRLNHEKHMEREVIKKVDLVLVPVDIMKSHLKNNYSNYSSKIKLLPHAFDKDEILLKSKVGNDKIIKIIFFGSLYKGIEEYIIELAKQLVRFNGRLELIIYSDSKAYIEIFEKYELINSTVFYKNPLPTKALFTEISSANYVLLIHPNYGIDNISTKFYEIIYSQTPILYIGGKGITSSFLEDNKVGYTFDLETIKINFSNIISGELPYTYNLNFQINEFSFENQTHHLAEYFI